MGVAAWSFPGTEAAALVLKRVGLGVASTGSGQCGLCHYLMLQKLLTRK